MKRKKNKKTDRHHLKARSRHGTGRRCNILIMDKEKHAMLHKIFGNRTLTEIIAVLVRLSKMKHYENEDSDVRRFYGKG